MKRIVLAIGASALSLAFGVATAAADDSAGQAQQVAQGALTLQGSSANAVADQNAVNANVPVTVAGGPVRNGESSANQLAVNDASADSTNLAKTDQTALAKQNSGDSHCKLGCGGSGQAQFVAQKAFTAQKAKSNADADQNAVDTNAPATIAGGWVHGGSSSSNQEAWNGAWASSFNRSWTDQLVLAHQT